MPVVIKLKFPAGRYHATPWGRHVNEGVAEWPPSPWRLLRALVAVWKRTSPDLSVAQVRRVLEPLTQPPRFRLPPHRVAHTRHYMPWEKKGPADRTLVFDTFVSVGRCDPLFIGWPDANLSDEDRSVLAKLLANLSSLGRAEGWVHAELTDEQPSWNCGLASEIDLNPVPVFCPDPATVFGNEHYPTLDPKKLAKGKVNPADYLFDCPRWHLCLDTETIHDKKWPTVPGARWVNYTRPLETSAMPARPKPTPRHKPTVARFLLDGPVLPLVTDTLRVAEAFRGAAMSQFKRWCRRNPDLAESFRRTGKPELYASPTLAGKEPDGSPRKDHLHAYYLPTAEGDDGRRLTHVTVTAREGFGPGEVAAFNGVRRLKLAADADELRVQLVGLGDEKTLRAPLLEKSTVWLSATPFLVTRYPKLRGTKRDRPEDYASPRDFVRHILREELQRRPELPAIAAIDDEEYLGRPRLRSLQFQRYRNKRGDDGGRRPAGAFRLRFAAPVPGPLVLGHSSHFGLGLFVPEADKEVPAH
jgi:CRISPR-associated protein Csb2